MVENTKNPTLRPPLQFFWCQKIKMRIIKLLGPNLLLPSKSSFYCPNLEPKTPSPHQTKPQCFEGSEDLDEYLAQFEILSELNRCDYHQNHCT